MKYFFTIIFFMHYFFPVYGQIQNSNNTNVINNSNTIEPQNQEELEEKQEGKKEKKDVNLVPQRNQIQYKSSSPAPAPAPSTQSSKATINQQSYEMDYNIHHQRNARSASPTQQMAMDQNVEQLKNYYPQSFEYHYFAYTSTNYDTAAYFHLLEAEKLKPENSDLHMNLLAHSIITENIADQKKYANKLVNSARITSEMLDYDRDMLQSVPANGFLITHYNDDTYGAVYLQELENFRKDVKIISLELMRNPLYLSDLKKEGLLLPKSSKIDVDFLKEFCALNASKSLSLNLSIPKEYFLPIKANLYVRGLTFIYSEKIIENIAENELLWEYDLDKKLIGNASTEKGRELSSNYLPMLFALRTYYRQEGSKKLSDIDKQINVIASQSNKYEQVQKLKKSY